MSRPQMPADEVEGRQILLSLASNRAAYARLLVYGEARLTQEEQELNTLAIRALSCPQDRDTAILQYGRVTMLRDLLSYAQQFIKQ